VWYLTEESVMGCGGRVLTQGCDRCADAMNATLSSGSVTWRVDGGALWIGSSAC